MPALGTAPICQLTADQISDFLRRLQRSGLSGKSARDIGVLLKSILKYTAKKLDCSCPGVNAELPVYHRKKIEVFFADEIGRLAKKVLEAPSMAGVGVLLALNAGLRLGELCALQYKDIDLCNGVIHVTKTAQRMKKGMHTHLVVQPPKTDNARRTIPLPEDMLALLRQTVCPVRNEENYFLTGKSAPLEPRTLQYQYRALLKAADPLSKFPCAAAHLCVALRGAGCGHQELERDAGPCRCPDYAPGLCPFLPGAQDAGGSKHMLPFSCPGGGLCAVSISVTRAGNGAATTGFSEPFANCIDLRKLRLVFLPRAAVPSSACYSSYKLIKTHH